ncbi:MAG: aminoacyl-tRNA hydrolase [bacterium]|nr:aminoacyl-tRNA hydrolase [bacterium]
MILLVGLGNPGNAYEETPHNIGRAIVRRFAENAGLAPFASEERFEALISAGTFRQTRIITALPETFMNNSGQTVARLATFYKIPAKDIWIVHDEADIPLQHVRIARDARSAGHRGVESIIEALGTKDFWRIRCGIKPASPIDMPLEAYVLKKRAIGGETETRIIEKAVLLIASAIDNGIEETAQQAD